MMMCIIINDGGKIMEILELRILKEVAYSKSISKAAENMGYVQSNITAHIKKLETELNTTLLIRNNKGVTLTNEGEKLLYQAEQIISLVDKTVKSFQETSKSMKIGTTQTIAGYLLPQCLVEYQKIFPNVSISVVTSSQNDIEKQLIQEQIDCIFTNSSYMFSQARLIYKAKETLMIIAPASCKTLEDLWELPVVVNNIASCPYRTALLDWMFSHSVIPKITELDTVEAIINTVSMGGGISLLPKITVLNEQKINKFYIEELQNTFISMWISKNKIPSDYLALKSIVEKTIIDNY